MPQDDSYFDDKTATFGDRITAAREAKGYGQPELARKLGVKLKTVRGWENDLSEPRANKLSLIAGITDVSIMWLLTGEGDGLSGLDGDPAPALVAEIKAVSDEISRLAAQLSGLQTRLSATLRDRDV